MEFSVRMEKSIVAAITATAAACADAPVATLAELLQRGSGGAPPAAAGDARAYLEVNGPTLEVAPEAMHLL